MLVIDFITDPLRQLGIISEIATPSAEQGADALTKLNDMMASLLEDGIDLGYNPKATTAETIALTPGDVMGARAMLGLAVCEGYGMQPLPIMAAMADGWYKRKLRQALYATMREKVTDAPSGENDCYRYNILTGQ